MDSTSQRCPSPDGLHSVVLFAYEKMNLLSVYLFTKHNSLQEAVSSVIVSIT
jgi:hypothetical protein